MLITGMQPGAREGCELRAGLRGRAGSGWGCVSPAPKMQACLRKSSQCSESYVIEVKCKQLAEKGCTQPGLPPSRAWRGERVVTGYSTYLAPFICKPWQV